MDAIKITVLVGLAALSGCVIPSRQVKVIKSETHISILRMNIEDGDVMVCDNNTCKVVPK